MMMMIKRNLFSVFMFTAVNINNTLHEQIITALCNFDEYFFTLFHTKSSGEHQNVKS